VTSRPSLPAAGLCLALVVGLMGGACSGVARRTVAEGSRAPETPRSPAGGAPVWREPVTGEADVEPLPADRNERRLAEGPSLFDPREVAVEDEEPAGGVVQALSRGEDEADGPERPIPQEEVERLRAAAELLEPESAVQQARPRGLGLAGPSLLAPVAGTAITSMTASSPVPPDPEVAVGPNHIVAVVNSRYAVYDKSGALLAGPSSLVTFFTGFAGTPGCSSAFPGIFDPNVLYDEEADRFVMGVDGGGSSYCIAVTTGPSPTGSWYRYAFPTNYGGPGFDFPHAGVGREAIYLGSNQFTCLFSGCSWVGGRVYAIDKWALYAGQPAQVVTHSVGSVNSTPQPANLHGYLQGTWPQDGPHYLFTEDYFGAIHSLWSWTDPFGANQLVLLANLNLSTASGVTAVFPPVAPQLSSTQTLESNDWRGLDTEYRNGRLWLTNSIGCNPGGGTVTCVRWAEVDPEIPEVVQAGVFSSAGEHRLFPDLAANHCDTMAVGYTKTSSTIHPAVWATGRQRGDTAGTLQAEVELRAGDAVYTAFDAVPHRWGDYTGMTVDPDGLTFWYYGEYAPTTSGSWGTFIRPLTFAGCPVLAPTPLEPDLGAVLVSATGPPLEVELFNLGNSNLEISGIAVGDATRFSVNPNGGGDPCGSTSPTIAPAASCTVELTFHPDAQAYFASELEIQSVDPSNSRDLPLTGVGYFTCPYAVSELLTNGSPETGTVAVSACESIEVGPYELGSAGDLTLLAGLSISFNNGTVIGADLGVALDPFLALP
jgi:hypothetical protein